MGQLWSVAARLTVPWAHWFALLLLCAAYLQGGLTKLVNFDAAIAEMNHFGLVPPVPFALATIVLELGTSVAILLGYYRWFAALALTAFTLGATLVANRFWEFSGQEGFMMANAFFEHLGLAGGFVLVAWHDLRGRHSHGV